MTDFKDITLQGDSTQRLLTCLGRFQRVVSSIEDETSEAEWIANAHAQLDSATEIVLEEGWNSAGLALTETKRLLAACQTAGKADQAVPYLKDAYEMLCLMVGDLIVGNARSVVRKKFLAWHADARVELAADGIEVAEPEPWPKDVPHRPAAGSLPTILFGWFLG